MLQEGSGQKIVEELSQAPRALVFISVPWSGPERNGREVYRAAIARLEAVTPEIGACFFHLNVDGDEASQEWLSSVGLARFGIAGAGSIVWLESGLVVSSEISAISLGLDGIVARTKLLWQRQA